jgi:hypothetical protein
MQYISIASILAVSAALAGCVTETSYNQARELVSGSPAMKRDAIERCYRGTSRASPARKAEMAKIMNVSARANVARIYCTRTFNGIASGRISYQDFRSKSPRFIRVIQGR